MSRGPAWHTLPPPQSPLGHPTVKPHPFNSDGVEIKRTPWKCWEPPLRFYHTSCFHARFALISLHIPEISPSSLTQQLESREDSDNKAETAEYHLPTPVLTGDVLLTVWRATLHPECPSLLRKGKKRREGERTLQFSLAYSSYPPRTSNLGVILLHFLCSRWR